MADIPWKTAILQVLAASDEPLHYDQIAQQVIQQGLRKSVGATPASTVASYLAAQLKTDVERTDRGYYRLRPNSTSSANEQYPRLIKLRQATVDT